MLMAAPKGNKFAVGNSGRPKTHTKEFIDQVGKDLFIWAKKPTSLFLEEFAGNYPEFLDKRKLSEFANENKEFNETFSKVKQILLSRIKSGACFKTMDGNFVAKILPLVDKEYKEWRKEELQLESDSKEDKEVHIFIHPDRLSENGGS